MIKLGFKIDNQSIADFSKNMQNIPDAALDETVLIMPVYLKINDVEIFKLYSDKNNPCTPLPIMNVACTFFNLLKSLKENMELSYFVPGYSEMKIKLIDKNSISIDWVENHTNIIANYNELMQAFQIFSDEVKDFINNNFPQLKQSSLYFGPWLSS